MTVTEARKILVERMRHDGSYVDFVNAQSSLIDFAKNCTTCIPGMGMTVCWDRANELAALGFHLTEIACALEPFPCDSIRAVEIAAIAIGEEIKNA